MGVISKIVLGLTLPIVLLLVVLAIFFIGEEGAWEELKDLVLGAKEVLPEVGFGLEELTTEEAGIPTEQSEAILSLAKAIKRLMDGKDCFANFGVLPELGEKGTTIRLDLVGDKTILSVLGGAGGKQVVTDLRFEFPGMKPCVIAGSEAVTERFYNHFIGGKQKLFPYYQAVNSIVVFNDGDNVIRVKEFGDKAVNDEGNNFENNGYIFTPDGVHICLFPTNYYRNNDEDGIANEWFGKGETNSIPNRVERGELTECEND